LNVARWVRFRVEGRIGFGTLDGEPISGRGESISVYEGNMFAEPALTGDRLALDAVEVLTPCDPTVMIGLWNNIASAAAEEGRKKPDEPLYFFKPPSCFLSPGGTIVRPKSHDGRIIFEAELGVVIGRRCVDVSESEVDDVIFGYTCVNDVTAPVVLRADDTFPQWCRSKSFDTFGPFGPVIATGVEPQTLRIQGLVDGELRQDYPASDLFYSPRELVCRISRDVTLFAGDIISCGTASGTLTIEPGATIEIMIEGIGTLSNCFA